MAATKNGGATARQDKEFSALLREVGEKALVSQVTGSEPIQTAEVNKKEEYPSITLEASAASDSINLADKVEERVRKRKPKKHKIGGYITEELYQKVHDVCEAKDISISDLFQAVLSEYVESVE